jgi:hypothetical protein
MCDDSTPELISNSDSASDDEEVSRKTLRRHVESYGASRSARESRVQLSAV